MVLVRAWISVSCTRLNATVNGVPLRVKAAPLRFLIPRAPKALNPHRPPSVYDLATSPRT